MFRKFHVKGYLVVKDSIPSLFDSKSMKREQGPTMAEEWPVDRGPLWLVLFPRNSLRITEEETPLFNLLLSVSTRPRSATGAPQECDRKSRLETKEPDDGGYFG